MSAGRNRLVAGALSLASSVGSGLGCSPEDRTRLRALTGDAEAQFALAQSLNSGDAKAENRITAAKRYRKAADQHVHEAQMMLGVAHLQGLGTRRDAVRAHQWLSLAVEGGFDRARPFLERVEKQLSDRQLARARGLAADWHNTHPAGSD